MQRKNSAELFPKKTRIKYKNTVYNIREPLGLFELFQALTEDGVDVRNGLITDVIEDLAERGIVEKVRK